VKASLGTGFGANGWNNALYRTAGQASCGNILPKPQWQLGVQLKLFVGSALCYDSGLQLNQAGQASVGVVGKACPFPTFASPDLSWRGVTMT
jgi:hypothetical protein